MDLNELIYLLQARRRRDQAPDTPAGDQAAANYWLSAYYKPAKALWWLYHYWGQEKFDRAMRDYYQNWQFRHPQPKDLQNILQKHAAEPLDWLFDGLLYSNASHDYAIKGISADETGYNLQLRNLGAFRAPVPLQGLKDGSVVFTTWLSGFSGEQEIRVAEKDIDQFVLDHHHQTLDINRKNNQIKTAGQFKQLAPLRLVPFAKVENEKYTSLAALPLLGWNQYDGPQIGLLLHNRSLPHKKLEFDLLALYGFRTGSFNGIGNLAYHRYPQKGWFREIGLDLNFRSFHFQKNTFGEFRYQRWQPALQLELRRPPASTFSHGLQYRLIALAREGISLQSDNEYLETVDQTYIHELSYRGTNRRQLNPYQYNFSLEQQSYKDIFGSPQHYLKWSIDWQSNLHYAYDRSVRARLFIGGFLDNTRRRSGAIFPGAFSLIDQAAMDYRFDDFYFGRSEREGFLSRQLSQRDGGFKTPVSPAFNLGKSNNYILALNLSADLPFGAQWPIRPYLDLGYFDNAMPTAQGATFKDQFLWSGGLALEVLDSRFGLYFPLINSKNIQDRLLENGNYWKRISFRFDLYGEKPRDIWENNW
jgi:hypothetical protein